MQFGFSNVRARFSGAVELSFLVSIFTFLILYLFNPNANVDYINIYMGRDLARAAEIFTTGNLILYGPDLSGGGHLPGPFFYILVGIPLAIFQTYKAVWIEIILLSAVANGLVFYTLFKKISQTAALFFTFYFISSPFVDYQLTNFWNPSLLYFFLAAIFFTISNIKKSFLRNFLLGVLTGLALQIHYSVLTILSSIIIFELIQFDTSKNLLRRLAAYLIGLFSMLSPYLYFKLFINSQKNIFFKDGSALKTLSINIQNIHPSILTIIFFVVLIVTAIFYVKKMPLKGNFENITLLIASTLLIFLPSGIYFSRYLLVAEFFFGIVSCIAVAKFFQKNNRYLKVLVGVFSLYFFLFSLVKISDRLEAKSEENLIEFVEKIRSTSNWDNVTFYQRSYFVGFGPETDFTYPLITKPKLLNRLTEYASSHGQSFSGFLGTEKLDRIFTRPESKDWQINLNNAQTHLTKELFEAFSSERIFCTDYVETDLFIGCFYLTKDASDNFRVGNLGHPYMQLATPTIPVVEDFKTGGKKLSTTDFIFKINLCDYNHEDCMIYFSLKKRHSFLEFDIFGPPLEAVEFAVNPAISAIFYGPQLRIECENGYQQNFELIEKIGYESRLKANTIAPYANRIISPCIEIKKVSLLLERGRKVVHNYNFLATDRYDLKIE